MRALAAEHLPPGSRLDYRAIKISPFLSFPFAFALQRIRLPRLIYPFRISMYHWRMA